MGNFLCKIKRISSFQIISLGFMSVILAGTLLLLLPISIKEGGGATFTEALFTATSAVCVTGLVVRDTATNWTFFGQLIIILLIQIGGLGVVTTAASVTLLTHKKIGLKQRNVMQEAFSAQYLGGIVRLTSFCIKFTFLVELIGAVCLFSVFFPAFGLAKGLWYSIFHSISAFCNAGFDLMGFREQFSSLTYYEDNIVVNLTIMALIVVGGLGFMTWNDIRDNKLKIRRYRLQTKIILVMTGFLIFAPAAYLFVGEFADRSMASRILGSLFQSVTLRTAGFNTLNLAALKEGTWMIMIILMLIGGSPGSTAGGMKTTTIAVLYANIKAVFHRQGDTVIFHRRISEDIIRQASVIFMMYVTLFLAGGIVISLAEDMPLMTCLFESASALGTVGLTLGITTSMGTLSRYVLIILMFMGRVGGLTLVFAASKGAKRNHARMPKEHITVG